MDRFQPPSAIYRERDDDETLGPFGPPSAEFVSALVNDAMANTRRRLGLSPTPVNEETLASVRWIDRLTQYPDADETVLGFRPDTEEPVWPVFTDGSDWFDACTAMPISGVTHWCRFPMGPHATNTTREN